MTLPWNVVVWDRVRRQGLTVVEYGHFFGDTMVETEVAVVIGHHDSGLVVLGGTRDDLKAWAAHFYMTVIQAENKHREKQ